MLCVRYLNWPISFVVFFPLHIKFLWSVSDIWTDIFPSSFCSFFFLLLVQHTPLDKLDKKHFAKGARGKEQNGVAPATQEVGNLKDIALMEAKMKKLCDLLSEVSTCISLVVLFFLVQGASTTHLLFVSV